MRNPARGRVSLRLDPDADERVSVVLHDDTVVPFGRGADCAVRFGHGPTRDGEVRRIAGWFVVAHGRVLVEAAPTTTGATGGADVVTRPLLLRTASRPDAPILPGWACAPPDRSFTVVVAGNQEWELDVVVEAGEWGQAGGSDAPTGYQRIDLSDEQWLILRAYARPVLEGQRMPATHDDVAREVHYARPTVRRRLDTIHDRFEVCGVRMPDVPDSRVKVVEGAINHGLLSVTTDA